MEKRVTPLPTGARIDAGATAIWYSGGANGLHGHNTPNGDRVSCVHSVGTFAVYGVYKAAACGTGAYNPIARSDRINWANV